MRRVLLAGKFPAFELGLEGAFTGENDIALAAIEQEREDSEIKQ